MPQAAVATTLYDRLGGAPAVKAVVKEFYRRILDDKDLKVFFAKVDMEKQMQHQTNFITMAVGGPKRYSGRTMKKAHAELKLTNRHFDGVAGHLVATLKWAKVDQANINEVVAAVSPLRAEVVSA